MSDVTSWPSRLGAPSATSRRMKRSVAGTSQSNRPSRCALSPRSMWLGNASSQDSTSGRQPSW
eukprot:366401-Chlamydomonas_euryale.AAC.10